MSPRPSISRVSPAQDNTSNMTEIENRQRQRPSLEVDDPDFLLAKPEDSDQGSLVEKINLKCKYVYNSLRITVQFHFCLDFMYPFLITF